MPTLLTTRANVSPSGGPANSLDYLGPRRLNLTSILYLDPRYILPGKKSRLHLCKVFHTQILGIKIMISNLIVNTIKVSSIKKHKITIQNLFAPSTDYVSCRLYHWLVHCSLDNSKYFRFPARRRLPRCKLQGFLHLLRASLLPTVQRYQRGAVLHDQHLRGCRLKHGLRHRHNCHWCRSGKTTLRMGPLLSLYFIRQRGSVVRVYENN